MKRKLIVLIGLLFLAACSNSGSDLAATSPTTPPLPAQAPTYPTDPAATSKTLAPGDYPKTIAIGTDQRSYILHVPANYDGSQALPLVYILHGYGGTAKSMVKQTSMNEKADQENFFVAYLQGTDSSEGKPAWNSGLMSDPGFNPDDLGFVRGLTTTLEAHLNVDAHRIYAAGFSNGAFMSHRLGADLSDILAGVAVVEGTVGASLDGGATFNTIPTPKGPIPVLMIHGLKDANLPYDGGQGVRIYAKPVSDEVDFWTSADTCTGTPEEKISITGNFSSKDYSACANGSEVELYSVTNGHHEWPTFDHTGFSATDAIWDFFSRHSKTDAE